MNQSEPKSGLCLTCENAPTCTFPGGGRPLLECEEFKGGERPGPVKSCEGGASVKAQEKNSGQWLGLCCDCGERGSCTFPKPEGGVWCCEEYR